MPAVIGSYKQFNKSETKLLLKTGLHSRGGGVDNAQALRACGPSGPHGFESHPRRQIDSLTYSAIVALEGLKFSSNLL